MAKINRHKQILFLIVFILSLDIAGRAVGAQTWSLQTVDSIGSVGTYSSITLDNAGHPHISYYDETNEDLKYARWTGSAWVIQIVDSNGSGTGKWSSIVLDSAGNPHISYFGNPGFALKYARWTGSSWVIQTLDSGASWTGLYTSIVLNTAGNPRISYTKLDGAGYGDLRYAEWNGSSWSIQTVDSAGDVGHHTSLSLDSTGNPHISYVVASGALKYAKWTGSSWNIQIVDSLGNNSFTSLSLDGAGVPHISYYNSLKLKYAKWTGSSWALQIVDSNGAVGAYSSLVLDGGGNANISYQDQTNNRLKYALWTGSAWVVETVDQNGSVGSYTSMELDNSGNPRISYYDTTNLDLKYANKGGGSSGDTQSPTAPSSLTATAASSSQINLSWTASTDNIGVTGYRVERCQGAGCSSFSQIATPTGASYSNTGLTAGTSYSYRVRANDAAANLSAYSNVATATTTNAAPATPTSLSAVDRPADEGGAINLTWTPSTATGITQQRIYRSTTTGGPYSLAATINNNTLNTHTDTGLTNGTTYYYVVRAFDGTSESANSNQAGAAPVDNTAPLAPTQLTAMDNPADQGGAINLSWTVSTSTDVTQQRLYRATASGGPYTTPFVIFTGNSHTNYVDTTVTANITYYYVVRAFDGTLESANSVEVSAISVNNRLATYVYDEATSTNGKGRLTSVTDLSGSTKFFYDVRGNINRTDKTINGEPLTYRIDYLYDSLNRLVDLTYPDPTPANRELVRHTYNNQGLLDKISSVTHTMDYVSNFDYNAVGRVTKKALGNGLTTDYEYYNANFRLRKIKTALGANAPLQELTYTYDNVGNVETIADAVGPADQTFTYDNLHRLITASSIEAPTYSHSYDYDSIGNMLLGAGKSFAYPFPGSPQPHAPTGDGTSTYFYSPNGNLVSKVTGATTRTFSWDVENRLSKIEENGATVAEFIYDHAGDRVKKIVGGIAKSYIGTLYECTSSSCTKYIFAGSERVASRPVGSTDVHYYHSDHLGSTSLVTNIENNIPHIVQGLNYYPYGKTRSESMTGGVAHKYTSQELDDETGLYNYRARYYDPALMRFISADTFNPDPSDPQTLNRYSYVLNNPLKYIDPTGHEVDAAGNLIEFDNSGNLVIIAGPDSSFSGMTFVQDTWYPSHSNDAIIASETQATINNGFNTNPTGNVDAALISFGGGFSISGSGDQMRDFAVEMNRQGIPSFGLYSGEDMIGAKIAEEIQRLNLGLKIDVAGHSLGGGNAVSMTMLAPGVRFRYLYTIDAVCAGSFCRTIGPNVQINYNWWQTNQWWFPYGGQNTAATGATVTIFNRSMTHLNLNHSTIVPPALGFIRNQYGIGP